MNCLKHREIDNVLVRETYSQLCNLTGYVASQTVFSYNNIQTLIDTTSTEYDVTILSVRSKLKLLMDYPQLRRMTFLQTMDRIIVDFKEKTFRNLQLSSKPSFVDFGGFSISLGLGDSKFFSDDGTRIILALSWSVDFSLNMAGVKTTQSKWLIITFEPKLKMNNNSPKNNPVSPRFRGQSDLKLELEDLEVTNNNQKEQLANLDKKIKLTETTLSDFKNKNEVLSNELEDRKIEIQRLDKLVKELNDSNQNKTNMIEDKSRELNAKEKLIIDLNSMIINVNNRSEQLIRAESNRIIKDKKAQDDLNMILFQPNFLINPPRYSFKKDSTVEVERTFTILALGETGSGKSTFIQNIMTACGDYHDLFKPHTGLSQLGNTTAEYGSRQSVALYPFILDGLHRYRIKIIDSYGLGLKNKRFDEIYKDLKSLGVDQLNGILLFKTVNRLLEEFLVDVEAASKLFTIQDSHSITMLLTHSNDKCLGFLSDNSRQINSILSKIGVNTKECENVVKILVDQSNYNYTTVQINLLEQFISQLSMIIRNIRVSDKTIFNSQVIKSKDSSCLIS